MTAFLEKLFQHLRKNRLVYKTIPATFIIVVIGYMIEFITTLPFAVLVWFDRRRRMQ